MLKALKPDNGYIFRITHKRNLPWIVANGLHCNSSTVHDPNFVGIGSQEIITKRSEWNISVPPHGTLSDYIPFYFTPKSIMLSNIQRGINVPPIPKQDILILVSSIRHLIQTKATFIYTNQAARSRNVQYFGSIDDIEKIDWPLLQACDFRRDPENDPNKLLRYQAEALVHSHLPTQGLLGIACSDNDVSSEIKTTLEVLKSSLKVKPQPSWYF